MSPEKRLQYLTGSIYVKQRNPNTWAPFPPRPSPSSAPGSFCDLTLIRKCWKGLILAWHQRLWSCTCASLCTWQSAAWQFTKQICVAIEYDFFFFWKLVRKCVYNGNSSHRIWGRKNTGIIKCGEINSVTSWKVLLCRWSNSSNSLDVKFMKINISSLLEEKLR